MNKKSKKESLVLRPILKKIAPRIGATLVFEPIWEVAGQITFQSGKRSYIRYNTLDLNPVGASDIAKDKDYANFFMEHMGYPIVPKSKTFFSDDWARAIGAQGRKIDDACVYAESIGWPVVVKPNSGSRGSGVALVHTKREFYSAMREIFKKDRIALVQPYVSGKDYRLVVLDEEVISAYERMPLMVDGDGVHSIRELLEKKQQKFLREKRDTQIRIDDPRIAMKLARAKLSLESVPEKGVRVQLLDNANLSTGGESIDVTDCVHPLFRDIAIRLTRDMGLRLCGVDLMVSGDITKVPKEYWILEINAAPGLDHYARSGKKQQQIVERMYEKVLRALDQ